MRQNMQPKKIVKRWVKKRVKRGGKVKDIAFLNLILIPVCVCVYCTHTQLDTFEKGSRIYMNVWTYYLHVCNLVYIHVCMYVCMES